MFLSIIVATYNRPSLIQQLYENLKFQELKPNEIIIVDSTQNQQMNYGFFTDDWVLKVKYNAPQSSCSQRNIGIEMLDKNCDIVAFLDDDVLLEPNYFRTVLDIYKLDISSEIAGIGGYIVGFDESTDLYKQQPVIKFGKELYHIKHLYGCNMTFRRVVTEHIRFDENLTLYAYMEDRDFSLSANQYGMVVRTKEAKLQHLQTPFGRMPEAKLGFAILGNTYYVLKKHNTSQIEIFYSVAEAFLRALANSLFRKSRRMRIKGAFIALIQIMTGKFKPQNILNVK